MPADGQPRADPRTQLRTWLPHLAVIGLVLAAVWWLLVVIAPVRDALLLAASLAALTYPVLFSPIDRQLDRWSGWGEKQRRYVSALVATVVLGAGLLGVLLLVLWALLGSLTGTVQTVIGLAFHDPPTVDHLVDLVVERAAVVARLYPDLHLDLGMLRQALSSMLAQTAVGPAMLGYLVTGTGGVLAQSALTLVTLFYLYGQGPRLVELMLSALPLSATQVAELRTDFSSTAVHLLSGTLGRALAHGLVLALLAWLLGGFNPLLVLPVAAFIALLPVVGPMVAWLPLASLLWTQGLPIHALAFAAIAIASWWLIEEAARRLAVTLGTDALWLSFLVFLAVVGGVLGFGWRGLVLGPAAVLALRIALQVAAQLYRWGHAAEDNERPGAA
jgi:predicted PurR-regulated permease PerM